MRGFLRLWRPHGPVFGTGPGNPRYASHQRLFMNRKISALGAFGVLLLAAVPALAEPHRWQLNMTRGVSETSKAVYDLHMLIFWICVVIGAIVFGAMAYAMLKFRKSQGAVAATWHHNTK